MVFDYREISQDILYDLPERAKVVVSRRFGLGQNHKESLQNIGKDFGVTRERVRQIEKATLLRIRHKLKKFQSVLMFFNNQLDSCGKLRRENVFLDVLGAGDFRNELFFLLFLANDFERFRETDNFHSLWTNDKKAIDLAENVIASVLKQIKEKKEAQDIGNLERLTNVEPTTLLAFLEVSKRIAKGPYEKWGLDIWPEINPRGIKDKILIILQKQNKPLHFTEIAKLIDQDDFLQASKKTNFQTVHNELIKEQRFILIGRGIYGLSDWGYTPGAVKQVIVDILKKSEKSLCREEILEKTLEQRLVKKNTILLNLRDDKVFIKDKEGNYRLQENCF